MTEKLSDLSLRQAAIIAGVAILMMTFAAVVATDLTMGNLIVEDNNAATFDTIKSSGLIFRVGIFSWLVILICDVLAAWGLYVFLKPVNNSLSLAMAWFRLIYTAILGTALLHYVNILPLITNKSLITAFTDSQAQALVMHAVQGFDNMWSLGLVVFGIHIYFLGHLIIKSGYVPKWLGVILLVAFAGYLITNLLNLLLPGHEEMKALVGWIFILPMLAEVYLGFWLLIRGIKVTSIR